MCSVGGGDFNIQIEEIEVWRYKCNDCGNRFSGMGGGRITCPSCHSGNVVKI